MAISILGLFTKYAKIKLTNVKIDMVTDLEESGEQVVVGEGKEHRGQHRTQAPV